jgi:pimeloyl-ACP methyl ester carboxylesterase
MIPRRLLILALIACMLPAGAQEKPKPFFFHLPGIGGQRITEQWLLSGLKAGGLDAEYRVYDWTEGDIGLPALLAQEENQARAKRIAAFLADHIRQHPDQRIIICSHSGGSGLAAWALEALPDNVQVDSVVMIAPALSPQFDLTRALAHVKGKVYVLSSPLDVIVGAGTRVFGTIDGVKTEAAGYRGFERPPAADQTQYAKIVHLPYQKEWFALYGNAGTHICAMRTSFARGFIAPLLLTGKPTTRPAAK